MSQLRTTPAWVAVSGVAFAAYPALRPWGPESGAEGAAHLASTAWVVSHLLGMVGFAALALGLRAAAREAPWHWGGQPVAKAEARMWLAAMLLLPYYGAEAYGLQAVATRAVETGDPALLEIADAFRYAPVAVTSFGLGLLLLVLVGARLAHGLWQAGTVARIGGLLAGLTLATYLPQFFGGPAVRVTHGLVLGAGLLLLAAAARQPRQAQTLVTATSSSAAPVP